MFGKVLIYFWGLWLVFKRIEWVVWIGNVGDVGRGCFTDGDYFMIRIKSLLKIALRVTELLNYRPLPFLK